MGDLNIIDGELNISSEKLQESLTVLLSLYVMIEQNYEALSYYETFISEESDFRKTFELPEKKDSYIDEAIIESLWFQIILKACSLLEEWDKTLGIMTETVYKDKIQLIKKIVKPARKAIDEWKGIRSFRNEIIAHNFRDKKGLLKLFEMSNYDCPQTDEELSYLVAFLNRMVRILSFNLPVETNRIVNSMGQILKESTVIINQEDYKFNKLSEVLIKIDDQISEYIFAIPRYDIHIAILESIKKNAK